MSGGNDIIHQAVRLKIMASLNVLHSDNALEFTRLRGLVDATDGNLGAHLDTLERAGYVAIEKRFEGKKPPSLEIFLEYLDLSEEQFNDIVAKTVVPPNEPNFQSTDWAPKTHDFDRWYREEPKDRGVRRG